MAELQREIHRCARCIFVAHRDFIFVPDNLVKEALNNDYNPVFINFFTLPGWSGHAAFYGFICQECRAFSVDYPHGYTGPGLIFLTCQICQLNLILLEDEIYEREGMKPPPSLLEVFCRLMKLRFAILKSRFAGLRLSWNKKLKT